MYSELQLAAHRGDTERVRILCEQGAKIDAANIADGKTALHLAAENGHTDTVRVLLETWEEILANTDNSCTALLQRALNPALRHGPIIDATTGFPHKTALQLAAANGHTDTVRVLCEHGANVNADYTLTRAAENGHTDTVRVLCEHGANVNADHFFGTALHCAVAFGHADTVRVLCEHGANVNAVDYRGQTALHYAVAHGNASTVRFLCEHGANVNAVDNRGQTALHIATQSNLIECVRPLLTAGARHDLLMHDEDNKYFRAILDYFGVGTTAKDIARQNGHWGIARLLKNYPLRKAALEVAFSSRCYVDESKVNLPYPSDTDKGIEYALGIVAQLKSTPTTPDLIMQNIVSFMADLSEEQAKKCIDIVADRKQPQLKLR